ncbi:hypothetical protein ASD83_18605 [Devosia sp. Root685]|uniref:YoaK family protein n=1 Tax=Devosia sp. Root685 TaxID=1736587 RepID=UPI0006FB9326|nr:YoaK family protein [Devosia sp. Root685]KRA95658.1 hypothetical protein ASD83_18605 [Devosia sp. Root685]
MLISEGHKRTFRLDGQMAVLFAAMAGALNAAGFQAAGFFSANMTGNASSFSDHLALGDWSLAGIFALFLSAFILGAMVSGLLIQWGGTRQSRAKYAYGIVLEGLVVFVLGGADLLQVLPAHGLVLGLSFAMGIQNAATTRISNARVRTTHVSGMATDIGLGLAGLIGAQSKDPEATARLRLYSMTMAAFIFGGILGVAAYLAIGGWMFVGMGLALLTIALMRAFH